MQISITYKRFFAHVVIVVKTLPTKTYNIASRVV